ncbi:hypothetical protein KIPB_000539 [Kipferlia bialata]|uniref:Protein kinase domain-containing protein n=1 Tax=Kipferlia bialata TaxID=797122 RepID=A0A391NNN2_9EUKA|nr:hypothetical protein KIPB_000539 [Kipferlia bialata]|eukprot:g539.t1
MIDSMADIEAAYEAEVRADEVAAEKGWPIPSDIGNLVRARRILLNKVVAKHLNRRPIPPRYSERHLTAQLVLGTSTTVSQSLPIEALSPIFAAFQNRCRVDVGNADLFHACEHLSDTVCSHSTSITPASARQAVLSSLHIIHTIMEHILPPKPTFNLGVVADGVVGDLDTETLASATGATALEEDNPMYNITPIVVQVVSALTEGVSGDTVTNGIVLEPPKLLLIHEQRLQDAYAFPRFVVTVCRTHLYIQGLLLHDEPVSHTLLGMDLSDTHPAKLASVMYALFSCAADIAKQERLAITRFQNHTRDLWHKIPLVFPSICLGTVESEQAYLVCRTTPLGEREPTPVLYGTRLLSSTTYAVCRRPSLSPKVAKITRNYNIDAHILLAKQGLAPNLILHQPLCAGSDHTVVLMEDLHPLGYVSVNKVDKLTESMVGGIMKRVRDALRVLHDAHYVHGDIHMTNVMVIVKQGVVERVCLIDFEFCGKVGDVWPSVGYNPDPNVFWPADLRALLPGVPLGTHTPMDESGQGGYKGSLVGDWFPRMQTRHDIEMAEEMERLLRVRTQRRQGQHFVALVNT